MGRPKGSKDKKVRKVRHQYKIEDLKWFKENYLKYSHREISKYLGWSIPTIKKLATEYGFRKITCHSKRYNLEEYRETIDKCGVYIIENLQNGKRLIGCSENISQRILDHLNRLKYNTHKNSFIQADWNSGNKFVFWILEECSKDDILIKEAKYIKDNIKSGKLYNKNIELEVPEHILIDNFWNRVAKSTDDECWEWTGRSRKGYGLVDYHDHKYTAHRIAYYLYYGEYPKGKIVMHLCNNKKCCNPSHLKLGTNRDNIQQAVKDGLFVVTNKSTKTIKDVEEVYKLVKEGKKYEEIDVIMNCNTWTLLHRTKYLADGINVFCRDKSIRRRKRKCVV